MADGSTNGKNLTQKSARFAADNAWTQSIETRRYCILHKLV